jgi:hypothetical protein
MYLTTNNDLARDRMRKILKIPQLKGLKLIYIEGSSDLFDKFQERDFHQKFPDKSVLERFYSAEHWTKQFGTPQQRESWFLSKEYQGPYDDLFDQYIAMVQPIIDNSCIYEILDGFLDTHKHNLKNNIISMGVHKYDPEKEGVGLREHRDAGIVSIIMSDRPVECLVMGVWKSIQIPRDHVAVFDGLTISAAHNTRSMLHRVSHCVEPKFTIGAFVGADPSEKLVIHPNLKYDIRFRTVAELNRHYMAVYK